MFQAHAGAVSPPFHSVAGGLGDLPCLSFPLCFAMCGELYTREKEEVEKHSRPEGESGRKKSHMNSNCRACQGKGKKTSTTLSDISMATIMSDCLCKRTGGTSYPAGPLSAFLLRCTSNLPKLVSLFVSFWGHSLHSMALLSSSGSFHFLVTVMFFLCLIDQLLASFVFLSFSATQREDWDK